MKKIVMWKPDAPVSTMQSMAHYLSLDLSDWNESASQGLREAAEQCFPDSNINE